MHQQQNLMWKNWTIYNTEHLESVQEPSESHISLSQHEPWVISQHKIILVKPLTIRISSKNSRPLMLK